MGPKVKASLVLLAVFGLGFFAGTAWQCYRFEHGAWRTTMMARRLDRLKSELNLTPDQEKAVRAIFDLARQRAMQVNQEVSWDLSDIHRDAVRSIRQVLTPEQRKKFEQLHHRAHGRLHRPPDDLDGPDVPAASPGRHNKASVP